jgi:hypothetical protein
MIWIHGGAFVFGSGREGVLTGRPMREDGLGPGAARLPQLSRGRLDADRAPLKDTGPGSIRVETVWVWIDKDEPGCRAL